MWVDETVELGGLNVTGKDMFYALGSSTVDYRLVGYTRDDVGLDHATCIRVQRRCILQDSIFLPYNPIILPRPLFSCDNIFPPASVLQMILLCA